MTKERLLHSARLMAIRTDRGKAEYLRTHSVFGAVGRNCRWGSWLVPLYPELIRLHNNVVVHKDAHILTHDMMNLFLKTAVPGVKIDSAEILGPVEIHDNVYVSMGAIIMPNVEIGKNCIISANAVVTEDVPENSIVAGNPAKIVGKFDSYVALRSMFTSNEPVFTNQYLPKNIAEQAWEKFEKRHHR